MEGVEPTTPRLQITCSSQLSYIGISFCSAASAFTKGIAKIDIYSESPKLLLFFLSFFFNSLSAPVIFPVLS